MIIINIITIIVRRWDKNAAIHHRWRVREKDLLLLVGIGGSIGGLIGMMTLYHKVSKSGFQVGFWSIVLLQILVSIVVLSRG